MKVPAWCPIEPMKVLLPLSVLLAMGGCATAPPPFTAEGPLASPARVSYRACTEEAMRNLTTTARPDPALQVATIAEGLCAEELLALKEAVRQDNAASPYARDTAEVYIQELRRATVRRLAASHLKGPL